MQQFFDCDTCAFDSFPASEAPCKSCTRLDSNGKYMAVPSNYAVRKSIDDATPEQWNAAAASANAVQVGGQHYASKTIQPWDYILANNLGYLEGNVVKYVSRWQSKGGVEDLKKARHYLDKLIEVASK